MTDIVVPDGLWAEDDQAGSISVWLFADGAQVNAGDVLCELMVEKVTFEIDAPVAGTLKILVEPEVPVDKGALLATID